MRARVTEVREIGARDRLDRRIDVVEANGVAGAAVRGERSRSEPDHTDAPRPRTATRVDGDANSGVVAVVGGRRRAEIGAIHLLSVLDDSVKEGAHRRTVR